MAKIKVKKVGFLNSSGEQEIYVIPELTPPTPEPDPEPPTPEPDPEPPTPGPDPEPPTPEPPTFIGPKPGEPGYGAGVYPGSDLEGSLGLTPMPGYNDPSNDNYGNYQNSDGSIFVFIPKFYYSFNCKPIDTYYKNTLTYSGLNEAQLAQIVTRSPNNYMALAPSSVFANEAEANSHGFILHRAFIDGGREKSGFFIAKYLASKGTSGTSDKALFIKNGKTISLGTNDNFTTSKDMPECRGKGYDAITLSKAINPNLNCASVFMYSALAMQSKFIGTVVTSTSQCAWYDSNLVMNFPKGCTNALSDINDSSVTYSELYSRKPLTGSGTPFAKTTHNGLNNGVCDVNGCMYQIATGMVSRGDRILKESARLSDITTDNVDDTSASIYNTNSSPYIHNPHHWGNSSHSSWRKAINGLSRAMEGVYPISGSQGCSNIGTNEFGKDYCYVNSGYSAVLCSGFWNDGSDSGVFHRTDSNWSIANTYHGFRSGGYAS